MGAYYKLASNGVPLCWWHHRSLGQSGWEIRMDGGLPQIRGPAWWDPEQRWRTPRLSGLEREQKQKREQKRGRKRERSAVLQR